MDETTLRILEVIGVWVSSIGTLAAVIVSLWLARREAVRLQVSASHRLLFRSNEPVEQYVYVQVINVGTRPARLLGIGWQGGIFKWGPFKKQFYIQNPGHHPSNSQLPITLQDGDVAIFMFDHVRDGENWYRAHAARLITNWIYRRTARVVAWTSAGPVFYARPDESFFGAFDEAMREGKKLPSKRLDNEGDQDR
jgi:hypothetical protein